ncbi:hypothetical protein PAXINDRAFT_9316 [Paxillus involutus ATCC 200175]|nr:hypothetical protein PAXINDRAFT_9316 [Paxillus involutus ATCC 200175]
MLRIFGQNKYPGVDNKEAADSSMIQSHLAASEPLPTAQSNLADEPVLAAAVDVEESGSAKALSDNEDDGPTFEELLEEELITKDQAGNASFGDLQVRIMATVPAPLLYLPIHLQKAKVSAPQIISGLIQNGSTSL